MVQTAAHRREKNEDIYKIIAHTVFVERPHRYLVFSHLSFTVLSTISTYVLPLCQAKEKFSPEFVLLPKVSCDA